MILLRASVLCLGLEAHRSVARVAARLNAVPKPWLGRDICTNTQDKIVHLYSSSMHVRIYFFFLFLFFALRCLMVPQLLRTPLFVSNVVEKVWSFRHNNYRDFSVLRVLSFVPNL